jgi:hypothetical protein
MPVVAAHGDPIEATLFTALAAGGLFVNWIGLGRDVPPLNAPHLTLDA